MVKTVWEGIVEVFDLHGHPKANIAYAWSHATDDPDKPTRHVTVRPVPPGSIPGNRSQSSYIAESKKPCAQQKKPKKAGRPPLPKGSAKVGTLRIGLLLTSCAQSRRPPRRKSRRFRSGYGAH